MEVGDEPGTRLSAGEGHQEVVEDASSTRGGVHKLGRMCCRTFEGGLHLAPRRTAPTASGG